MNRGHKEHFACITNQGHKVCLTVVQVFFIVHAIYQGAGGENLTNERRVNFKLLQDINTEWLEEIWWH